MKKHLLIGLALGIGTVATAQNVHLSGGKTLPKIKSEVAKKTLPYNKHKVDATPVGFQAAVQSANIHKPLADPSRAFTSTVIGTTMYDLQTNASICNRIVVNTDGTIAATWTMSHDTDPTSSPNRGSGYVYYDGANWGTPPASRLESVRTGWPSVAVSKTGGEFIVSHEATSNPVGNIHLIKRAAKGTGAWHDTTLNYPDTWPRMVVAGANGVTVHIISQTSGASTSATPYHGQDGALAYSRSLDGGITWDKYRSIIPEIDSSQYLGFGGDAYAIDARGDTIAIVAGGFDVDVVLLKSTDNGTSWTKTIVSAFPKPLYNSQTDNTDINNDNVADTIVSNDASLAVLLDNQGKAHVWYGAMRVLQEVGAANMSYFPGTDGLFYWNETSTAPALIAGAYDLDGDGILNVSDFGTYQVSLTSMPSAGIDAAGNLYLSYASVYEGVAEEGEAGAGKSYRHTYLIRSTDGGATWSDTPADVVNPYNTEDFDYTEGVFGAVAKRVDDHVHLIYQKDTSPGHALSSNGDDPQSGNESEIVYVKFPTPDFNSVGIKEEKGVITNVSIYPNPASSSANVVFNMEKAGKVSVKLYNMVGQEVNTFEENLPVGNNTLTINVGDYTSGVYFIKTTVANNVVTKKLIVE